MATVKELDEQTFGPELAKHKIAIVDYYASWCGSCRLFAPSFEKVASANTEIAFFKVDGDENPSTREGLSVDNLPFVAIFENGKPIGGVNLSKEEALLDLVGKVPQKGGPRLILAVVKDLAGKFSKDQLNDAISAYEADRTNDLKVEGKDEGEILSNLLVAAFVRTRMDKGMAMQDAIREYSSRVRGMISPPKK